MHIHNTTLGIADVLATAAMAIGPAVSAPAADRGAPSRIPCADADLLPACEPHHTEAAVDASTSAGRTRPLERGGSAGSQAARLPTAVEARAVWTGDAKDHPGYGPVTVWTGDAKDHPGYGPVTVWTGDAKDHPGYGPVAPSVSRIEPRPGVDVECNPVLSTSPCAA
jgi:hypothetical protein